MFADPNDILIKVIAVLVIMTPISLLRNISKLEKVRQVHVHVHACHMELVLTNIVYTLYLDIKITHTRTHAHTHAHTHRHMHTVFLKSPIVHALQSSQCDSHKLSFSAALIICHPVYCLHRVCDSVRSVPPLLPSVSISLFSPSFSLSLPLSLSSSLSLSLPLSLSPSLQCKLFLILSH